MIYSELNKAKPNSPETDRRRYASRLVIFDLDDTLIDTSRIFFNAREAFLDFMEGKGYARSEAVLLFDDVDKKNLSLFGYISERNLVTMRETYELLTSNSSDRFSHADLQKIALIGGNCLYKLPKRLPFAKQLIKWCSRRFRMVLMTRGSTALQYAKLNNHGLASMFERVLVVKHKDAEIFLDIARQAQCTPEECISVGDSMRFDVIPAFEAGMCAIHVEYPHHHIQWAHDKAATIEAAHHIFRAANLREVLPLLSALYQLAG